MKYINNYCREFYLVLITNYGKVIHDPFARSHKDLINKYLTYVNKSDNELEYFKAKFSPKDECKLTEIDNYSLIIQETYIPEWFRGGLAEDVMESLHDIIRSMIVTTYKPLAMGEGLILNRTAIVDEVKNSVIFAMYETASINHIWNSEVHLMTDGARIVQMNENSIVLDMSGYARISEMHMNSCVVKMYGQAKVSKMLDNSRIQTLKGDSNITEMQDESEAEKLKHNSRVDEMRGYSVIEEMWDWTTVNAMYDSSQIIYMDDDANVKEMHGHSVVVEMFGNSVVKELNENSLVKKINDMAAVIKKQLNEES
jgi:predicted GNAT family acetyltransferase